MAELQASPATFEEVLQQADIISLHTPLTEATHHLIGERELRLMKPNVILINTSRGPVVDEQALVEALKEHRIAAAALDVFETEPLPDSSPLRRFDNVVLTPHVAAYTDEFIKDFWHYSVEAVCDMARGFLPESYVNPQAVDRCGFVRRDQD
jgi:phosphoglycerate dehydrogenase-like enzyme